MELPNYFRKLFEYDHWANREALTSLSSVSSAPEEALHCFAHVIGAQRIWLSRINQDAPSPPPAWPSLTLDECQAAVEDLHERWKAFCATLNEAQLSSSVCYRNSKGAEFTTPLEDVLQHVVLHSAYHRGQVAAVVRRAGGKPASTDYSVYIRQNPVGP
jgi:uncharacterized damage-inducible protein DinB